MVQCCTAIAFSKISLIAKMSLVKQIQLRAVLYGKNYMLHVIRSSNVFVM
jgi:hypothetical protein